MTDLDDQSKKKNDFTVRKSVYVCVCVCMGGGGEGREGAKVIVAVDSCFPLFGARQYARIFFTRVFSGCYTILTSPKEGETAVYGYNPALF